VVFAVVFSVFFFTYLNGFIQSKPLYSHKPVLGFVEAATGLIKKAAFYAPLGHKPSNCGNTLKQFQPSESGNTSRGTSNDSWYGKIEIDDERKWVIRSQAPKWSAVHRLNVGWRE
jgi:hypothetical protein